MNKLLHFIYIQFCKYFLIILQYFSYVSTVVFVQSILYQLNPSISFSEIWYSSLNFHIYFPYLFNIGNFVFLNFRLFYLQRIDSSICFIWTKVILDCYFRIWIDLTWSLSHSWTPLIKTGILISLNYMFFWRMDIENS